MQDLLRQAGYSAGDDKLAVAVNRASLETVGPLSFWVRLGNGAGPPIDRARRHRCQTPPPLPAGRPPLCWLPRFGICLDAMAAPCVGKGAAGSIWGIAPQGMFAPCCAPSYGGPKGVCTGKLYPSFTAWVTAALQGRGPPPGWNPLGTIGNRGGNRRLTPRWLTPRLTRNGAVASPSPALSPRGECSRPGARYAVSTHALRARHPAEWGGGRNARAGAGVLIGLSRAGIRTDGMFECHRPRWPAALTNPVGFWPCDTSHWPRLFAQNRPYPPRVCGLACGLELGALEIIYAKQ